MHPSVTFGLVLLAAILNIANLSYDASLINNLNSVPAYFEHFNLNSGLVGLNVAIVNAGSIKALEILAYLHANGNTNDLLVQAELNEISNALEYEKEHEGPWKSLWTPREMTN
ncbi:hypothetical protein SLS57_010460 [Botryosphaeria dothidea]